MICELPDQGGSYGFFHPTSTSGLTRSDFFFIHILTVGEILKNPQGDSNPGPRRSVVKCPDPTSHVNHQTNSGATTRHIINDKEQSFVEKTKTNRQSDNWAGGKGQHATKRTKSSETTENRNQEPEEKKREIPILHNTRTRTDKEQELLGRGQRTKKRKRRD
jgi:hypothetical protein